MFSYTPPRRISEDRTIFPGRNFRVVCGGLIPTPKKLGGIDISFWLSYFFGTFEPPQRTARYDVHDVSLLAETNTE